MRARHNIPRLRLTRPVSVALVLAVAAGAAATMAQAQPADQEYVGPAYVEDLVIAPPAYRRDRDVTRLSRAVSYADLDLTTSAGQETLRWRIRDTARSVCRALGESPASAPPLRRSCEADAVRSARSQFAVAVGRAYAQAETRAYADLDY